QPPDRPAIPLHLGAPLDNEVETMPGCARRDDLRPGFEPALLDPVRDPLELGVRDACEQRHLLELLGVIGHGTPSSSRDRHAPRSSLRPKAAGRATCSPYRLGGWPEGRGIPPQRSAAPLRARP